MAAMRLSWSGLLSETRLPAEEDAEAPPDPAWLVRNRTEAERDFDRILFATPTRRLGDKPQVFPLEKNESVRTRLTHSCEVSNLARSIGTYLVHGPLGSRIAADAMVEGKPFDESHLKRSLPATLAAVGLAHNLGNPPFGHQGEADIRESLEPEFLWARWRAGPRRSPTTHSGAQRRLPTI
jgi:dGTPase